MHLFRKNLMAVIGVCCLAFTSQAAITQASLAATQDSYTDSRYPTANYGSNPLNVGTYLPPGARSPYFRRSFVDFDISSIPDNAIIYSAKVRLKYITQGDSGNPLRARLITSTWTESEIMASNEPTHTTLLSEISDSYTVSGGYVYIDVKDMTQRFVHDGTSILGWMIQVQNETQETYEWGFWSRESANKPVLEIEYYLPLTVTSATVSHESGAAAADGSISFSIANAPSSSFQYQWYDANGAITNANQQSLSGLNYGWYGVHVTGDQYNEELYYAFIVGLDCQVVNIAFQPDDKFVDNAYLTNKIYGGFRHEDINYGNYGTIAAENEVVGLGWNQSKSLAKFKLWMDYALGITQANLTLTGNSHSGSNESQLNLVTEAWNEVLVTYNTVPNTSTSTQKIVPLVSGSDNSSIDMLSFWSQWQANNASNHGVIFEMSSYPNTANKKQTYHSPTASSSSNHPKIDFIISMLHPEEPHHCNTLYATMERKLSGIKYLTQVGKLYFSYDEEYLSASTNLTYKIYKKSSRLNPQVEGTMLSYELALEFGRNQFELDLSSAGLTTGEAYTLEVENDKGEKRYLRFIKD